MSCSKAPFSIETGLKPALLGFSICEYKRAHLESPWVLFTANFRPVLRKHETVHVVSITMDDLIGTHFWQTLLLLRQAKLIFQKVLQSSARS